MMIYQSYVNLINYFSEFAKSLTILLHFIVIYGKIRVQN